MTKRVHWALNNNLHYCEQETGIWVDNCFFSTTENFPETLLITFSDFSPNESQYSFTDDRA